MSVPESARDLRLLSHTDVKMDAATNRIAITISCSIVPSPPSGEKLKNRSRKFMSHSRIQVMSLQHDLPRFASAFANQEAHGATAECPEQKFIDVARKKRSLPRGVLIAMSSHESAT